MIRSFESKDLEAVIQLWVDASVIAHSFMPAGYWQNKTDDMRNIYLPSALTYVYEEEGRVLGFISMVGDYIAAVFVLPGAQGRGIGTLLMGYMQELYGSLELAVYKENLASVAFYRKLGFKDMCEQPEENTGHTEILMKWESFGESY